MQPPYNDRWERTKRYLLRNFLVNPGFRLSPIPEEERSSPDSGSLPDLVLEPAPDRHDHPPDYYEGLERRMKRYYRQLFLGGNESDDDSSDFEVNRSMASTFRLDINARQENEANLIAYKNSIGDLDNSIAKKKKLTKSTNESDENRHITKSNESLDDENESQDKYDDELIDTRAATYSDTRHVSADSKYSSVEDEENFKLIETRSINESIHSYKTDDDVNIEHYDNNQIYDRDNQPGPARVKKSGDLNQTNVFKINEAKSDSEDAALCHRISTTVADIHEIRPERRSTQVFDNGSPVLIPRLLQFSRRVFGSRKSGESFNVSGASDEFIRRLSSHRSDASNKHDDNIEEPESRVQRLLAASELTRHIVEYIDTEDKHQDDVNKNDTIEGRTGIEDIIQPHEITRASLASNKTLDTENIEDYVDTEENKQEDDDKTYDIEDRMGIDDIIQPHEITRASLASNKTLNTENIEDYDDIEARTGIEDIIQPHEITRASLASNKKLDTEIEDYDDIEARTGIEDIIQPHDIRRASIASNNTLDTGNIEHHDDIEARTGIEDIIQPHEITRASLASKKKFDTEIEDYDDIEARTGIEDIIQPHDIRRASLASNKTLDTENIEDYDDIEDRTGIEDIIQPHEITRAGLASNKTLDAENLEDYVDTEENKQGHDDKTYDIEGKSHVSEIEGDNEGDNIDTDVDETDRTEVQNTSINCNDDCIDDDEDSFENAVRRGVFARKARKMVFVSSSEESFDELEPIAYSSAMSIDDEVEVMREAREAGGNERWSWHGEAVNQDSPALAFETQTNADKSENESSDSTEINASFEDEIAENIEDPHNTNSNDIGKIIDEFWSVSPEDVDIESPIEVSRSNKRRTDSEAEAPSKRKKVDVAIQAGPEDNCRKWEDVRTDFFMGTPLVFRLCGCQDHVCS